MTPHHASLINVAILILCSVWGFFSADKQSFTALIPAGFGIAILLCNPGVKSENKVIAHIAVLLTLIVLCALFMPLRGALGRGDGMALLRVGLMGLSCVFAIIYFIKSFRDARKARESEGG